MLQGGSTAREALSNAIDLKRRWLIHRGEVSSAFLDPSTRECLLDLAEESATGSIVMRLLVDGEPVAVRFGFEYQGTYFAYISAYDEAFASLSPGKMLMDCYLSRFHERQITALDMLPPSSRHKTDWCPSETFVADYTLPLTRAGRAYAELYQELARPALIWTWQHLPTGIRSLAAAALVGV
jgi:CelD/BcsL family acetyltransferase involved in cellulose biosynthesis